MHLRGAGRVRALNWSFSLSPAAPESCRPFKLLGPAPEALEIGTWWWELSDNRYETSLLNRVLRIWRYSNDCTHGAAAWPHLTLRPKAA